MDEAFINRCVDWKLDPVLFVREIIGADPTEQQIEILKDIAKAGSKVSVKAGTGVGKTTLASWVILWFLAFHQDCKCPCTSPSSSQLFDNLWSECAKWIDNMPPVFKDMFDWRTDTIKIKGCENRFAVARTARPEKPEALQGFHATNLMFVVDEASGVAQKVFEVAEGSLSTPGTRVLLIANPTRTEGYFYDSHNKNRKFWSCHTLSCVNSPRVDKSYIENSKSKYGEDSPFYKIRVLGEFPDASEDCLIRLCDIEDAVGRNVNNIAAEKIAGLDVARFGNDATAIVIKQGTTINYIDQWRGLDTMATCGKVKQMFIDKAFTRINVDVIGVGAGVADRLIDMGIPTCPINVAESSSMSDKFVRLRDELWWKSRELFSNKLSCINKDIKLKDDLIGELSSIRYRITGDGKIKIESKDDMKKRGLSSPNIADALCLSLAEGMPVSNSFAGDNAIFTPKADPGGWAAWI